MLIMCKGETFVVSEHIHLQAISICYVCVKVTKPMTAMHIQLFTNLLLPSVLWHCWLGHLTHKTLSPIWPVMCLVGCYTLLNWTWSCAVKMLHSAYGSCWSKKCTVTDNGHEIVLDRCDWTSVIQDLDKFELYTLLPVCCGSFTVA